MANIMPSDYEQRLTATQLDVLVAFLLQQREEPEEAAAVVSGESDPSAAAIDAEPTSQPTAGSPQGETSTASGVVLLIFIVSVGILLALSALAGRRQDTQRKQDGTAPRADRRKRE